MAPELGKAVGVFTLGYLTVFNGVLLACITLVRSYCFEGGIRGRFAFHRISQSNTENSPANG